MDLKLIQKLIAMMRRGELDEMELEDAPSGLKVRLRRTSEAPPVVPPAPIVHVVHGGSAAPAVPMAAPGASGSAEGGARGPAEPPPEPAVQGTPIQSPMVGTFYRSPSPEAEPFVQVGSRIQVDNPLCIIEAMKVMNEIKSEIAGEILEILVENGEPVEFGQPLFLVDTGVKTG